MLRQKDVDARWTKRHGKSYYGYKNHISIDREHKRVRHFEVPHAAVHDSLVFDLLLETNNTSADLWADSAHRSEEREADLKAQRYRSHIQTKGTANKPLFERAQKANHRRARVRVRVEHVFAAQTAMGGMLVRTIGFARARVKIAMMNIVYNLRRVAYLHARSAAGTA